MKSKLLIFNTMLFLCLAVTVPSQAQNDDCRNLKKEIEKCLSDDNCAGAGALYDTYKELCNKDKNIELRIANCNLKNEKPNPTPEPSNKLTITAGGVSFDMVYVEGGTFTMGCTSEQGSDCWDHEKPAHQVTLSGFYIGENEVTQALWRAVMGGEPKQNDKWTSDFGGRGDNYPAYCVSWEDVQTFIERLNRKTGKTFRLPTEAEWEYAARGGSKSKGYKYSGSDNIDQVSWYSDNSGRTTHQVKTKSPNELGLYDMSGNVGEWCLDWYGRYDSSSQTDPTGLSTGQFRVNRGGSWYDGAKTCCVWDRSNGGDPYRSYYLGFRLVLVNEEENNNELGSANQTRQQNGTNQEQTQPTPPNTPTSGSKQTITVGSVSFDMVYVEGGPFTMGCTSEQGNWCFDSEKPTHQVTLSSYYIGETEVTQALWKAVMNSEPTYEGGWTSERGRGDKYPAYRVSWDDVQSFIERLNRKTGYTFRLPTEAEWEYAARGGRKRQGYMYSGSDNIDQVAWFGGNSKDNTLPVKKKIPNELGLYDMSGNVSEWCSDWYGSYSSSSQLNPTGPSTGSHRVNRGGSWDLSFMLCRVSNREGFSASRRSIYIGFRLVLVDEKEKNKDLGSVNRTGQQNENIRVQTQPTLPNTPTSGSKETITVGGVSFEMVYVEGGMFTMGCTSEQGNGCADYEKPGHSVTLSSYYIGETEVTQGLWKAVLGNNPSEFKGDDRPVENVSWDDAQTFIRELNHMTGRTFRLPTEAEWEYAARGGRKSQGYEYSGSDNIDQVAWYGDDYYNGTHPVKTKSPNELGIYDMSGNLWEWCSDWYGSYDSSSQTNPIGPSLGPGRVLRGGCWDEYYMNCRVSERYDNSASSRFNYYGFRLVLVQ